MKKKPASQSGIFNPRALTAFALLIVAGLFALIALGAVPASFDKARFGWQTISAAFKSASASPNIASFVAWKQKLAARGGASKLLPGMKAPATSAPGTSPGVLQHPSVNEHRNTLGQTVYTIAAEHFDVSPPLSELAALAVPEIKREERAELELPSWRNLRSDKPDPVVQVVPGSDSSRSSAGPAAPDGIEAAAAGFNFAGISGTPTGGFPPDNNGSVGNDQFVEMVNTRYQVWSLNRATKTATSIVGPAAINTLWAGFGGACQTRNDGDPVVLYDKVANRWLLSQFTSTAVGGSYYQCVAISTTPNAAGTYYRYAFAQPNGQFGDYPHYGVWSDAYYIMAHQFTSSSGSFVAGVFGAMDRTKMLAGDPTATWQVILDPLEGGHMPADLDGFAPPPAGAPGIFTSVHVDGMYLYRMKVDFSNPANTTRTLQAKMPIAPPTAPCGGAGGQCIPQPNSAFMIDSLGDRLMFRLAYRNFIDHESLVISHSVDPGVQGVVSGVRWYEFRLSGQPDAVCAGYPCTYQQGTVADVPNGRSRWMPSIAQDGGGNMIVGYSATGTLEATDAHSIRYTGRASNNVLGTMTVPETIIATGMRNIVSDPTAPVRIGRWGDYTSTSIDPGDDCTFWHVNEYYAATSAANPDWRTQIASVSFSPTQCQPNACTSRPTSAPLIGSATAIAPNQIEVTWTAITPAPGSYAVERAVGAPGSESFYQPLAFVSGDATNYIDNTVQGGLTYSYRVIAATDGAGRCQALVRSGAVSATATGGCNLKPIFAGITSATSLDGANCGITLSWAPGTARCPLRQLRYNIYRGTVPDFVPSASNRIASCIAGPTSYVDTDSLISGNTYYYVVRAEDNGTGGTGTCGGNEESNNVHIAATAYGAGAQAVSGTWTDGGGDVTSLLRLNPAGTGNSADPAWRIVFTADDAGANHTPGGGYAYRNAGPGPDATYASKVCAVAETPVLTVGSTTLNLTYWERHQLEKGWDGVALEYSRNGGAWIDIPAPSNLVSDGCMVTDVTTDYQALGCTADPPINACGYPASKMAITGPPTAPDPGCVVPTGALTAYGRRCHLLTGLTPGDTIQFRWRFTSDPGADFAGFYLDDIAVTNIRLRNACTTAVPPPVLTTVVSRKIHGSIPTPFDITMPLVGAPGIECRGTGSTNNDYTLVFSFANNLNTGVSTTATVTTHNPGSGTGSVNGSSFGPLPNQYTVNLSGVSTGQYITVTLNNVVDLLGHTGNVVGPQVGILVGDVNQDKFVLSGDYTATRQKSGTAVDGTTFKYDLNADGVILSGDYTTARQLSGTQLP